MKRKNCRDAVGKCDQQTRLSGVDPNRNYGGLWDGSGASPNPLSDVYRGPGPFSEPKIQNVRELVASRQVVTLITNDTCSNLVLRVPGHGRPGLPLEEPQYKEFHPPYETGVVAAYLGVAPAAGAGKGGNREAYYEMLESTADSSLHSVLTGSAPTGSKLTVRKSFTTSKSPVWRDEFCTELGPGLRSPTR